MKGKEKRESLKRKRTKQKKSKIRTKRKIETWSGCCKEEKKINIIQIQNWRNENENYSKIKAIDMEEKNTNKQKKIFFSKDIKTQIFFFFNDQRSTNIFVGSGIFWCRSSLLLSLRQISTFAAVTWIFETVSCFPHRLCNQCCLPYLLSPSLWYNAWFYRMWKAKYFLSFKLLFFP